MPTWLSLPPVEISPRREGLNAGIASYQGTRAARRRMEVELEKLGQRRKLSLPPELMGIIFDFYVHLYDQLPERLLLVCRAWHVLALSQPTLWTNLDPLDPFGLYRARSWMGTFLQSRIARSNPAPLKVDFTQKFRKIILLHDITEKVAAIDTFLPRIQDLVINDTKGLIYLVGDQPLLRHLSFTGNDPNLLDDILANPVIYKLSEKMLTTLHFRCRPKSQAWPESLLRRLHTLGFWLTSAPGVHHECRTMIQKSTSLLALHITIRDGHVPLLSHASCRNLTIGYNDDTCSLEGVRMPRLQELTIVSYSPNTLMQLTLAGTPISSLLLICNPTWPYVGTTERVDKSWVNGVIHLLRSAPRLEKFEISALPCLVAGVSEAFAEDPDLCTELSSFLINGPTDIEFMAQYDAQKNLEARIGQLRSNVSTLMEERRLRRSKN